MMDDVDAEYWSSNGAELDQDDPEWNDKKKAKKLKRSKLKRGRKKTILGNNKLLCCTQCDHKPFESKNHLKEHLNKVHDGIGLDKMIYKCDQAECFYEADNQKILNDHKNDAHGIALSFKCKVNYSRNHVRSLEHFG